MAYASSGVETPSLTKVNTHIAYRSADAIATVAASNYFNSLAGQLSAAGSMTIIDTNLNKVYAIGYSNNGTTVTTTAAGSVTTLL